MRGTPAPMARNTTQIFTIACERKGLATGHITFLTSCLDRWMAMGDRYFHFDVFRSCKPLMAPSIARSVALAVAYQSLTLGTKR